jgi:hypothetical protein
MESRTLDFPCALRPATTIDLPSGLISTAFSRLMFSDVREMISWWKVVSVFEAEHFVQLALTFFDSQGFGFTRPNCES